MAHTVTITNRDNFMARGFYLYGGTPDALANQQFGYDQFFTRTAEGNRAAMADAERFNIQAFLQAQAADEDARQRDAAMRASLFQNEQSRGAAAEQNAFARSIDARNFAAQEANRKKQEEINAPLLKAQTELMQAQAKSAAENTNLKLGHELATRAAEQGLILSPKDAEQKFGLPQQTASLYFERSKDIQNALDAQDAEIQSAAKIMTAYQQAKRQLAELAAKPVDSDFWVSGTPNADARKVETDRIEKALQILQPRVDFLQSNRRQDILSQLQVDPETGVYTPILPQRPWRAGGKTSTGTTGTSSSFFPGQAQPTASGSGYSSAEQVREAMKNGSLTRQEALGILRTQFGFD